VAALDERIPMFDFDPRDRDEDVRDVEMDSAT
jgi:hypothetical protein